MSRSKKGQWLDENQRKEVVFDENSKSVGVAYLLWFFFGLLGAHRFYVGNTKGGAISLLLFFTFIGIPILAFWWLIDAFRIPGMVSEQNMQLINMINYGDPDGPPMQIAPPEEPERGRGKAKPKLDDKRQAMLDDLRATGYRRERRDDTQLYR